MGVGLHCHCPCFLVEVPAALCGATQTRNFILLDWEMIICGGFVFQKASASSSARNAPSRTVSYLVTEFYILFGVDDDLLLAVDGDDLSRAIGIT